MRLARIGLGIAVIGAAVIPVLSQTSAEQKPSFEVASIKPTSVEDGSGHRSFQCRGIDNGPSTGDSSLPLGRCLLNGTDLVDIIRGAYRLPDNSYVKNQMTGDRGWLSEQFNIEAKAEDPSATTMAQLMLMIQNLLADRFKLQIHRETQNVQGYALVPSGNGSKLHDTGTNADFGIGAQRVPAGWTLTAHNASMKNLSGTLTSVTGAPVVDQTGFTGTYDFALSWGSKDGGSLFTSLQEQLSLKLISQKVPMEFIVIDHAERPTAN